MEKKGVQSLVTIDIQSHHDVIPGKAQIYTHRGFTIGYNGDRIVEVNMTSYNPVPIEANTQPSNIASLQSYSLNHIGKIRTIEDRIP